MKFEEMLLKRESCRSFRRDPVAREDLVKICEAGRLTPSGCNSQPWKFLVADDDDAKAKICDALVVKSGFSAAAFREDVPAFIAVVEQKAKLIPAAVEYFGDSQVFAQGDLGAATLNLCYQALELGLSTCILGMVEQEKMQAHFGISEDETVRVIVAVGYPKTETAPRTKARKPFDEVVCFNEWK